MKTNLSSGNFSRQVAKPPNSEDLFCLSRLCERYSEIRLRLCRAVVLRGETRETSMLTFRTRFSLAAALLALAPMNAAAQPLPAQPLQKVRIVRLDAAFDRLVPPGVVVERVVGGRKWVEGPVWNRPDGYLLFSDIPANSVLKWQQGKGTSVFLQPSGYTGKTPFLGRRGSARTHLRGRRQKCFLSDPLSCRRARRASTS